MRGAMIIATVSAILLAIASGCARPAALELTCAAPRTGATGAIIIPSADDLEHLAGRWYEIARLPNLLQREHVAATVEYELTGDGGVAITNRARKGSLDGPKRVVRARGAVVDSEAQLRLKVRFLGLFEGECRVIGADRGYEWVLIGSPGRDYLWVLSRTASLDRCTYAEILAHAAANAFDTQRLMLIPQPTGAENVCARGLTPEVRALQ
jgi:apolipoprotein D and lipocalin family protein